MLESEPSLVDVLAVYLRDAGFDVEAESVDRHGFSRAETEPWHAFVLDVPAPIGRDAFRRLRVASVAPIVAISSSLDAEDRAVFEHAGTDDYLRKPFRPYDVVAKVTRVLARARRAHEASAGVQRIGPLAIDRLAHEVRRHGVTLSLTPMQFRILDVLAGHVGQALTREQLIARTSPDGDIFDRTLDRHIGNLRLKVEDDPAAPRNIVTVPFVGYKLVDAA